VTTPSVDRRHREASWREPATSPKASSRNAALRRWVPSWQSSPWVGTTSSIPPPRRRRCRRQACDAPVPRRRRQDPETLDETRILLSTGVGEWMPVTTQRCTAKICVCVYVCHGRVFIGVKAIVAIVATS
jgi:hypothetical protein